MVETSRLRESTIIFSQLTVLVPEGQEAWAIVPKSRGFGLSLNCVVNCRRRLACRHRNARLAEIQKYGLAQRKDEHKGSTRTCVHSTDPTQPIGRWKEAWESAKNRAGVQCRFHDLRHTGCTRMLEAGVPYSVVATIMGWSASNTVRMSKRYGHIGHSAQRLAVDALCRPVSADDGAQNEAQSETASSGARAN